jgi:hypothetical protein
MFGFLLAQLIFMTFIYEQHKVISQVPHLDHNITQALQTAQNDTCTSCFHNNIERA